MWEHVELREVEVFLTLSELLHFGQTAERLQISHGRVSQILQDLEAKLGVRLLDRTSRRVTLTPAGARLRTRLGEPYAQLREVLRDTRAHAEQITGELRLGLLFPSSGGPKLPQIIDLFERRHPGASVSIRDLPFDDPLGPLRRGEIDVMACRLPINQPDLTVGPVLASDHRILAVAIDHPLANRKDISVEDLADCLVHDAGGRLPREYIDTLVPPRTPRGRRIPRRHIGTPSPTQLLAMVARGEIVHPTISTFPDHFRHPNVTFVPIRDLPPMKAGLLWRAAGQTAGILSFAQAAADIVHLPTTATIDGRHRQPNAQRSPRRADQAPAGPPSRRRQKRASGTAKTRTSAS
jgi:DNA-binding transcriptional LysR family regulator